MVCMKQCLAYCCRACSVVASVQHAQVEAMQALTTLTAVMARSSPSFQSPGSPSSAACESLTCLEQALSFLVQAASRDAARASPGEAPGLDSRPAEYAIVQHTAQVTVTRIPTLSVDKCYSHLCALVCYLVCGQYTGQPGHVHICIRLDRTAKLEWTVHMDCTRGIA